MVHYRVAKLLIDWRPSWSTDFLRSGTPEWPLAIDLRVVLALRLRASCPSGIPMSESHIAPIGIALLLRIVSMRSAFPMDVWGYYHVEELQKG